MQKLEAIHCRPKLNGNMARSTRHPGWWVVRAIWPLRSPWIGKTSTRESFVSSSRSIFIYNSSQSEVVWGLERQIKIGLCFQSEIWVKSLPSEWKFMVEWKFPGRVKVCHPSELIIIRVKILPSEWKLADRVRDCLPSENIIIRVKRLPSEWKLADRVKRLPSKWKYSHPSKNCLPSERF